MFNNKLILFGSIFFILLISLTYFSFHPTSQIFGKVTHTIDTNEKVIFLTFDDGPGQETNEILDILKYNNITATFFVVGNQIKENPEILIRIHNEHHSIGVHSMTHPLLYKNIEPELSETKQLIYELTNYQSNLFRPPYGFRTWQIINIAENLGLKTITWSSFPQDYKSTKEEIISEVISKLKPGLIICLHDGPVNRQQTVLALPEIINAAKQQSYRFNKLE